VADQQPDFDVLERDELVALLREIYEASDVIRHARPRRSDEHPTMKPVGLLSRLIVNSAKKAGLVYDPFLGSGSTLIAAERQGRVCYGVELDPVYVDVVVRRWETVTGGKAGLAT
jgi:DNA modification methylase